MERSVIAFARGARTGVLVILTSMAVKTASRAAVNLLSRSRMRIRKPRLASSRSISRLRASWGEPGSGRMGGDAEDVHPRAGVLDEEQRVEPVQGDRVEVETDTGEDRRGLRLEELRPGRSGPAWCEVDAGGVQDSPDGGGADLVAESGRVRPSSPSMRRYPRVGFSFARHDHGADTGGDGGAACPDRPCGPATADELPMPAQDRGRGDQESAAARRGKCPAEGGDHGTVAPADPQLRVCVAAALPVDGAGRGSLWRCPSGRVAPSSSAASRTSDRSASNATGGSCRGTLRREAPGQPQCTRFRAPTAWAAACSAR
jgi:hypothetical protein